MGNKLRTKETFYCLKDGRFIKIQAKNFKNAARKCLAELIIQGKPKDIGVSDIAFSPAEAKDIIRAMRQLKKGISCSLIVHNFVAVADAIYLGQGDILWLAFSKNGVTFWVYNDSIYFTSIGGGKV